ncbi:3279_t:CDS:10 [Scutellospora calospora]|uniref:3279_t:CDS:1 n=1 Tax=Scutellospora calospora TaxID=85575 RepID=A0ACA9KLZ7_9GLOM|nr:3279_t:CDS:10 [Scutellospora calospora]
MTNVHITPRKLVVTGTIIPELHYGLEVMIQLNKMSFIIRVVRYIHSHLQPSYICEGSGQSSDIVTSSSNAITSVYQAIFGTKTKFASLSYLGLEQTETSQKLLESVVFYLFIIEVENLSIFVSFLGKISHSNKKTIGYNYTSSLFYKYKSKQSVFFQRVNNNNSYSIIVYQNSQIVAEYTDNSPNAVWYQTGILKSIPGDTLFAINHLTTLQKLNQVYQTNQILVSNQCTLADWNNKVIMEYLFDLHLKKAVSKSAEKWHQVFQNWKQQKSNIIELHNHLSKIYGLNHEFRERENEFWTNAPDPEKDHDTLKNLYENEILNVSLQTLTTKAFWDCFRDSYNVNLKGTNSKFNSFITHNAHSPVDYTTGLANLIAHAIKRYIRIGCNLTDRTNIETVFQNLSGISVAHIEPNRNKSVKKLMDQDNIKISSELPNHQLEANIGKKKIKTIPSVWTEFHPEQIATFYNRPSPIFSESSKPKNSWTIPIPKKTVNSEESDETSNAMKDSSVDQDFPLNMGWALKENMKLDKKGAEKNISKKVVKYLQGFFLARNLRADDCYSPEDMYASLEELAVNGELTFEEIPSVKTIKG